MPRKQARKAKRMKNRGRLTAKGRRSVYFSLKCIRCGQEFPSDIALRKHSKTHAGMARQDIELLRQGHVPEESKIGEGFKGKNKIIVS